MLRIQIYTRKDIYDLKLYSKVTLIVGLSGVQKTQMIKRIFENNPAVKKVISNLDYTPVFLTESTWHNAMESVDKKCVYFVDDEDFILEPEFIELYNKNKTSYFVYVNRIGAGVSYDIRDIYTLNNVNGHHSLQQKYTLDTRLNIRCKTFTEDEGSGLTWFKQLMPDCKSMHGVPNVSKFILDLPMGLEVNMVIDLFGMGYYASSIFECIALRNINVHFAEQYGSFEYLLLRTNLFRYVLSEDDILSSGSKEIACEKILYRLTKGKYYKYDKTSNLNFCYYKDCCAKSRKDKCDRGLSGDKIKAMLVNTEFEYLLNLRLEHDNEPQTAGETKEEHIAKCQDN